MKKIIPVFLFGMLVICGLEAAASPLDMERTNVLIWKQLPSESLHIGDFLDQSQPLMDWFGPIGPCPLVSGVPNYILAQSFTPTYNVITKTELMIARNSTTTYDYKVAIRDSLNGSDLTTISIPASEVTLENFSWEVFDFPDLSVVPGSTYYIVSSTLNATDNWYAWGLKMDGTTYPNGTIYYTTNDEVSWSEEPGGDMTFRTYGTNNIPPNTPILHGVQYGIPYSPYLFSLDMTDPNEDQLYCLWDWGDGNISSWLGPYNSGQMVNNSHLWNKPGIYTIKTKLKDNNSAESNWSEPFTIEIVDLKIAFFIGIFENMNETEDLIILHTQSFIVIPSASIFSQGRTIVLSKDYLGYVGSPFALGVGSVAVL